MNMEDVEINQVPNVNAATNDTEPKTVTLKDFPEKLLEHEAVFCDTSIPKSLQKLVKCMCKLTGYIKISKGGQKFPAMCFLQRIHRKHDTEKECAVLTFTTVYHVFGEKADDTDTSYILPQQFQDFKTTVKLSLDQNYVVELKNFSLVESDKEYFLKNDWCAIECEYDNIEKVKELEDCLQRYQTHQKEIFKISKESNYTNVNLVVIVIYKDGVEKRISIGRHYPEHKEILKEVRSGQRWCRYYYDAPTWPGNSGSPIYIFGQPITGFGYWFGHPHNHAKKSKEEKAVEIDGEIEWKYLGISSIGVEQIE